MQDGDLVPAGKPGKEQRELSALIRLRDAATGLLDAEADHDRSEESLTPLRARLNIAYDRYVATYGALNRATISRGEPDPETGLATDVPPAAADGRVPPGPRLRDGSRPGELRRRDRPGRQDPDLLPAGQPAPTATNPSGIPRLRRSGSAWTATAVSTWPPSPDCWTSPPARCLPRSSAWPTPTPPRENGSPPRNTCPATSATSCGAARAAAATSGDTDPYQGAGAAALEKVQPADLGPDEIRAKLGAPWIPASDVRAFAAETLGYAPAVSYLPVTAQWEIRAERGSADTAAATDEWGTGRIDAYRLLELAVNGKAPVIYDTVITPSGEIRVRNQAETMLAEEKQRALATRFAEWTWEDPERSDRLCADYNERFNSVVLRRYDGSYLTFPGLAAGFTPYQHQRDMVHRIISTPACLCPYPVGTGKTPTMFMAARKLKELGLACKPLIIVPNHLLEQTASEGKRLFPSARILTAAREDLDGAQARKLFAARCATGDWDAVVMTHSAFTAIPVHPAAQAAHLADLAARYRQALTSEPTGGGRTVKQLAKMIDAFETRARTLLDHRTDDGVYFEHLGADFLMVIDFSDRPRWRPPRPASLLLAA